MSSGRTGRTGRAGGPRAGWLAMERSPNAIPELDGIRAIAILLVVARHGSNPFWDPVEGLLPIGGWDLGIPLTNGWMGVDLFFVLSGFLITHQVVARYGQGFGGADIGNYLKRRMFRIVPTYVAVLAIAVLGLVPRYEIEGDLLGLRVGYHLLFLQDYLPSNIVVAFWSLGVEEKFYLLAPLILVVVLGLDRRSSRYGALVALALLPAGLRLLTAISRPEIDEYAEFFPVFRSPFHVTYDGLAVGVLVAFLYRDRAALAWTRSTRVVETIFWLGAGGFTALLVSTPHLDAITMVDKVLLQAGLAWSAGLTVLGLVLGGGPRHLLRPWWMLVVSKLAYAWYLLHLLFVPLALDGAAAVVGPDAALLDPIRLLVFTTLYVGLSLAAAVVVHYGVEKPFLLLRDRRRRSEPGDATVEPRTPLSPTQPSTGSPRRERDSGQPVVGAGAKAGPDDGTRLE